MNTRIVLACSGSLVSSAAIAWLADRHRAEIIVMALDLGQARDLDALRARALALGAVRAHVLDARDEFARDCILPSLRNGSGRVPRGVLAAPLVARKLREVASIEGTSRVAHAGGLDDHHAIAGAMRELDPRLEVLAPALEWDLTNEALEEYAVRRGIAISPPAASGRRSPLEIPAHLEVAFDHGVPVAVNGVPMPLTELLESVSTIAGYHGISGVSVDEPTMYERAAPALLSQAHGTLVANDPEAATGTVRMTLFKGELTIP